jgi:hypothetical protein
LKALSLRDEKGALAALQAGAKAQRTVRGDLSMVYHNEVPVIVLAAWTGNPNIVKAILDAGAYLDSPCVNWKTPPGSDEAMAFDGPSALGVACAEGHETVVVCLLELGASLSSEDVFYGLKSGSASILKHLIKAGASLKRCGLTARSPLGQALYDGRMDLVDMLDAAGAKLHGMAEVADLSKDLKGAAAAWLRSRSSRALIGQGSSWWLASVSALELDACYAELVANWMEDEQEWGAAIDETEDEELNFGAPYSTRIFRVTRLLGSREVHRVDRWKIEKAAARQVLGHRVRFHAEGLPSLLWQKPDSYALLCANGDEESLNHVDERLQSMKLSFELRKVGDADSEYGARQLLREVALDKESFHRLLTVFDSFEAARRKYEEVQSRGRPEDRPTQVIVDCHGTMARAGEALCLLLEEFKLRQACFADILLPRRMKGGKRKYRRLIAWLTEGGNQSQTLVPPLVTDRYKALLRELLNRTLVEEWGFGVHLKPGPHTEQRMPRSHDRAWVHSTHIHIPYFDGRFVIDFSKDEVHLHAIDQKTPAEEHWQFEPSSAWWQRALKCDWPVLKVETR